MSRLDEIARVLQGEQVNLIQRGPLMFVDVAGPLTASDARDLAYVLEPLVDRFRSEIAARAWEEGYGAAGQDADNRPYSDHPSAATWVPSRNPYRAAALTETKDGDQ